MMPTVRQRVRRGWRRLVCRLTPPCPPARADPIAGALRVERGAPILWSEYLDGRLNAHQVIAALSALRRGVHPLDGPNRTPYLTRAERASLRAFFP